MSTTPTTRHPWDQQENEPAAAFVRFLIFRNLGPPRDLDTAYQVYLSEQEEASEGIGRRSTPGSWRKDCVTYSWVERAHRWDIFMLTQCGQEAIVAFNEAIRRGAKKLCRALEKIDPTTWDQILETFHAFSQLIAPDAAPALHDYFHGAGGRGPAPGKDGDGEKPRIVSA
jgi:hypothetical protein